MSLRKVEGKNWIIMCRVGRYLDDVDEHKNPGKTVKHA